MTANPSISIRIGAGAHRGKVREENQDRISRFRCPFGEVFLVADGMGGHEGGAIAAQMVIDGMEAHLQELPAGTAAEEALRAAATRTNAEIYRQATTGDPKTTKMGATSVLALLHGRRMLIAHSGDSRAYLLRGGHLARLTRDHTMVQRMLEHNMLTEEEARNHPDANVVTRAFGQKPEIELEISSPIELWPGDRVLLCSDGLCGYVDDDRIQQALEFEGDAQAATDRLIDLALQAGGEDNVSVQVIAVDEAAPAPVRFGAAAVRPRRDIPAWMIISALLVAILVIGLILKILPPSRTAEKKSDGTPPVGISTAGDHEGDHEENATGSSIDSYKPLPPEESPRPEPEPEEGVETPAEPPAPAVQPELRQLIIVGKQRVQELHKILSQVVQGGGDFLPRNDRSPFEEGYVYFRQGSEQWAKEILSRVERQDNETYTLRQWPSDLKGEYPRYQVLITLKTPKPKNDVIQEKREENAARQTGEPREAESTVRQDAHAESPRQEEASSESRETPAPVNVEPVPSSQKPAAANDRPGTPEEPKAKPPQRSESSSPGSQIRWGLFYSRAPRSQVPDQVPDRVKGKYKDDKWSRPKQLPSELEILVPGHIYYQPGFGTEAGEVAGEMSYSAEVWPRSIPRNYRSKYDILIILRPVEPQPRRQDRSNR